MEEKRKIQDYGGHATQIADADWREWEEWSEEEIKGLRQEMDGKKMLIKIP